MSLSAPMCTVLLVLVEYGNLTATVVDHDRAVTTANEDQLVTLRRLVDRQRAHRRVVLLLEVKRLLQLSCSEQC